MVINIPFPLFSVLNSRLSPPRPPHPLLRSSTFFLPTVTFITAVPLIPTETYTMFCEIVIKTTQIYFEVSLSTDSLLGQTKYPKKRNTKHRHKNRRACSRPRWAYSARRLFSIIPRKAWNWRKQNARPTGKRD